VGDTLPDSASHVDVWSGLTGRSIRQFVAEAEKEDGGH